MKDLRFMLQSNILGAIFNVTHLIYLRVLLLKLIELVLTFAIMYPIVVYVLGIDVEEYFGMVEFVSRNPTASVELVQYFEGLMEQVFSWQNVLILILTFLIIMLFSAYIAHVIFNLIRDIIKGKEVSLSDLLIPFDRRVLRLALSYFIFGVLLAIIFSVVTFIGAFTFIFAILIIPAGLFFIGAVFMRYILMFPDISLSESQSNSPIFFSSDVIHYKKAMKYTLIAILVLIALSIAQQIGALFEVLLSESNFWLNMIVSQIVALLLGAYSHSFMMSCLTCRYMREFPLDKEEDLRIEDHLVE